IQPSPTSDSRYYYETAVNLASGNAYSANGEPTAWRPPGYSGFLALLFRVFWPSTFVASIANVALYAFLLLLWYRLVRIVTKSDLVARLSLLVLAFVPNHIAYSSLIASEIFALFLATLGLLLLLVAERRPSAAVAAGIVFGAAALVRPVLLLLPLVGGAGWFVLGSRIRSKAALRRAARLLLVVHFAMALVVTPWIARNHAVFGHYVFANESGVTFLVGNNPYATGGWRYDERVRNLVPFSGEEFTDSAHATDYALRYARAHPVRTLLLMPKKIAYIYAVDHDGAAWNRRGMTSDRGVQRLGLVAWAGLSDLSYWAIGFAALVGLWKRLLPTLAVVTLGFFTAAYLPFFGTSRFHFLAMPWLALGAASVFARRRAPVSTAV
ncbi:MAG: glycosyltransferase family 39 protein, partial [Actinomycetota bacterium]